MVQNGIREGSENVILAKMAPTTMFDRFLDHFGIHFGSPFDSKIDQFGDHFVNQISDPIFEGFWEHVGPHLVGFLAPKRWSERKGENMTNYVFLKEY